MESVPAAENFSLQYITERLAATAELPANMLAVKVKSFLDPLDELQDYEDFFAIIPLPKIAKVYQTNDAFAEQRLSGANPLACIIHEDFGKSSKALARSSSSDLAEKQSVF
jgi:arachidonate 15-lipoxygenase